MWRLKRQTSSRFEFFSVEWSLLRGETVTKHRQTGVLHGCSGAGNHPGESVGFANTTLASHTNQKSLVQSLVSASCSKLALPPDSVVKSFSLFCLFFFTLDHQKIRGFMKEAKRDLNGILARLFCQSSACGNWSWNNCLILWINSKQH